MVRYAAGLMLAATMFINAGCGDGGSLFYETVPGPTEIDLSDTFVYNSRGRYADVVKECVTADEVAESCSLEKLPLLGQESPTPTKEMIMQRVVVSHAWMAQRFERMLDILDDDVKQLLGAVTAIVIDDDIMPSFYWTLTGAIYIDPRYLWLTPQEAATIAVKEDFRVDYGKELNFIDPFRYVKDGDYAYDYYPLGGNASRTVHDIKYALARLLYHELLHANDFAPPSMMAQLERDVPISEALEAIHEQSVSSVLYGSNPLQSTTLMHLGQVMYHGENATEDEKRLTPREVGQLFADDFSNEMYAYSSRYEDAAMLFEAALMKYHYDIEMDVGFTTKPTSDEDATCNDYILGWGERNRVANPAVSQRALFIMKSVLPDETDWDAFFSDGVGTSRMLLAGLNWCESISFVPASAGVPVERTNVDAVETVNPMDFEKPGL